MRSALIPAVLPIAEKKLVGAMPSPHTDSSSETYTISGSSSICDEEETDDNLSEEPIQAEKLKRRFKFMSVKALIGNESNIANLDEKAGLLSHMYRKVNGVHLHSVNSRAGITIPEMATITEVNLLEIPTDTVSKACSQENSREASNVIISNKPAITNVPSNSSFSKINSESYFCEVPPRETLSKSFSNKISSKTSIENISGPSSCATESDESLIQSPAQAFSAENTDTLLQKTAPKTADAAPINITEAPTSVIAQEEISDAFLSPIQDKTNEASNQNLVARITASAVATQPVITAGCVSEDQILQQVQVQHSLPAPISESSEKRTSPSVPAQAASQTSESDAAQTHTIIPESLSNLASVPIENSIIPDVSDASIEIHPTNEVIPSGAAATTPETSKIVESDVMEKDKRSGVFSVLLFVFNTTRIVWNDCVLVIVINDDIIFGDERAGKEYRWFRCAISALFCILSYYLLNGVENVIADRVSCMKLFGKKKKE
ncbi:unnamed protein product [Onchocerca flexuosa]|uniref:Pecanex-like protein n=1 Tax=Onchocerca flexuosa TaxID=387005 RepID=A0A183H143_9BILA|nr:unnamed protein product [Onchocerca flexuosa]